MSIPLQIKHLLNEVLSKENKPQLGGANLFQINAFAEKNSVTVPPELEAWLLYCNGLIIDSGELYGVKPLQEWLDIDKLYGLFPVWKEKGWIPVAGDGCGNYYVLVEALDEGSSHPVYFIDTHENPDYLTYAVASNIWNFIRFLLGKTMGEDYWPFEKEKVLAKDPTLEKCKKAPLPWEL